MKLAVFRNEKVVNLDNVSNIYIDRNSRDKKVIFNMNYSVKIFNNKFTPDYVYWNFETEDDLKEILDIFYTKLDTKNWILPQEEGQRYINKKCVSSITLDNTKNRVIFNLNYNVTHPKSPEKLTSDFTFFDFKDIQTAVNFYNKIINENI